MKEFKTESKFRHAEPWRPFLSLKFIEILNIFKNIIMFKLFRKSQELSNKVADMAISLKPGAFFISSGNINNPKYGNNTTKFEQYFTNLDYKAMRYSWGLSSVYIHRRNHQEVNV